MPYIPKLKEGISPKAIKVWRTYHIITAFMKLFILFALLYLAHTFYWDYWIRLALYIVLGSTFIKSIYQVTLYPVLLHKTWRFQVNDEYIQTMHGFFHKHYTIIPMTWVTNVQTYDGPLLRKLGLVTITINTLTSSVHIPGLLQTDATYFRKKILDQITLHKQMKIDDSHG